MEYLLIQGLQQLYIEISQDGPLGWSEDYLSGWEVIDQPTLLAFASIDHTFNIAHFSTLPAIV